MQNIDSTPGSTSSLVKPSYHPAVLRINAERDYKARLRLLAAAEPGTLPPDWETIAALPIWCCWRYRAPAPKKTDDEVPATKPKFGKVPVAICSGTKKNGRPLRIGYDFVGSNDRRQQTTFAEAVAVASKYSAVEGVGICFYPEHAIVGIDLDNVRDLDTGTITNPLAQDIIDQFKGAYLELSPSGKGFHILCRGKAPRNGKGAVDDDLNWIETYDRGRFFTFMGADILEMFCFPQHDDALAWLGNIINAHGARVDKGYAQKKEKEKNGAFDFKSAPPQADVAITPHQPDNTPRHTFSTKTLSHEDQQVVKRLTVKNSVTFDRLFTGKGVSSNDDHSALDNQLCALLAWATQCNPQQIDRIFRASALYRDKWDEMRGSTTYGEMTMQHAIDKCNPSTKQPDVVKKRSKKDARSSGRKDNNKGGVLKGSNQLCTEEKKRRVIYMDEYFQDVDACSDIISELVKRKAIYRFDEVLVEVKKKCNGTSSFSVVKGSALTSLVKEHVALMKSYGRDNNILKEWNPPSYYITGMFGLWKYISQIPQINGVSLVPLYNIADGTIKSQNGYDEETGIYINYNGKPLSVPKKPTHAECKEGVEFIIEWLKEFPFESYTDRSTAISAIFSAPIRPSLPTSPMFAIDAPMAGSGKSILVDLSSIIASGRRATATQFSRYEEELEKRIGSALMAGETLLNFDNVTRDVNSATLCSLLTQSGMMFRVLGKMSMIELPCTVSVFVTGNNLQISGDLTRRTLCCRLSPLVEFAHQRPFERDIIQYTYDNRHKILSAIFTILRGHLAAGSPKMDATPFASYEVWSNTIRSALLWLGQADPLATQNYLLREDSERVTLSRVLAAWWDCFEDTQQGAFDVAQRCMEGDVASKNLLVAITEAFPSKGKQGVDMRALGKWLQKKHGGIAGGFRLIKDGMNGHTKKQLFYLQKMPDHVDAKRLNVDTSQILNARCTEIHPANSAHSANVDAKRLPDAERTSVLSPQLSPQSSVDGGESVSQEDMGSLASTGLDEHFPYVLYERPASKNAVPLELSLTSTEAPIDQNFYPQEEKKEKSATPCTTAIVPTTDAPPSTPKLLSDNPVPALELLAESPAFTISEVSLRGDYAGRDDELALVLGGLEECVARNWAEEIPVDGDKGYKLKDGGRITCCGIGLLPSDGHAPEQKMAPNEALKAIPSGQLEIYDGIVEFLEIAGKTNKPIAREQIRLRFKLDDAAFYPIFRAVLKIARPTYKAGKFFIRTGGLR